MTKAAASYQPGSISSLLLKKTHTEPSGDTSKSVNGKEKKVKGNTVNELFSEARRSKIEPVVPLPAFNKELEPKKKIKKTKKGKIRPPRPSKKEKEAQKSKKLSPMEDAEDNMDPGISSEEESTPLSSNENQKAESVSGEDMSFGILMKKNSMTVFVGNLPLSITKARLKSLFKGYGEIDSVRLRSMALTGTKVDDHGNQKLVKKVSANKRMLSDAKDSYNGYVVFKSEASVLKALQANNRLVENKRIRVDRVGLAATRDPKRTVFLGNLPFNVKDEEIRAHFGAAIRGGEASIEAVRIVRDPETFVGKGFGFLLLKDRASVAAVLRLHGSLLGGKRPIRVTTCGKRSKLPTTTSRNGKKRKPKTESFEGRRVSAHVLMKKKNLRVKKK